TTPSLARVPRARSGGQRRPSVEPRRSPEPPARSGKQREHGRGETHDPSPADGQLGHAGHHPEADERRGGTADEKPIEPGAAAGGRTGALAGEGGPDVCRVDAVARAFA